MQGQPYLQKASPGSGPNLFGKKGLGLSDYWLDNFCLTTTFLFLSWNAIRMLLPCQFQRVRSSGQSPWGDMKSGLLHKRKTWSSKTWWRSVSLRNRPKGVLLLLLRLCCCLGSEASPGFAFIFSRKLAVSQGTWPFMEGTHTFMGQQAEGSQQSPDSVQNHLFQAGLAWTVKRKSQHVSHGKHFQVRDRQSLYKHSKWWLSSTSTCMFKTHWAPCLCNQAWE